MSRIKQLPPHEAHKIAAGEVVERPANVVKELLENALDAQATTINIYIQQSGKSLIRIVDDGHGMSPQDAHMCLKHHATSKITRVDDLATLTTFGFRGEALSSISSVSHTTLITKEQDASTGTQLDLEAGAITKETSVSCNTGTDISIKQLFYNVPARKKFLKLDATEWRHILSLFQAYCLAHNAVNFKLFHNDTLVHNCPATDTPQKRPAQLWEQNIARNMMPIATNKDETFSGMISNHYYARYDRSTIFFFVNKRWIKNIGLSRALTKGYMNVLPQGRYPSAVIFIDIDPTTIDINIHPRKEEITFLHPRRIEQNLKSIIKDTLEQNLSKQIEHAKASQPEPSLQKFNFDAPPFQHNTPETFITPQSFSPIQKETPTLAPQEPLSIEKQVFTQTKAAPEREWNIIGQAHKTYIILEHKDGLYMVDQHAAHERVLYEQFVKRFENVATVQLMFPVVIEMTVDDCNRLEPYCPLLNKHGIAIERMGDQQCIVTATPVHAKKVNIKEIVYEFLGWLTEYKDVEKDDLSKKINEHMHAQMACKAAVKAGDTLTQEQIKQLLDDLYKTKNRFSCPHGRPTGWLMTTHDIEKKFKRKV